jgi:hypothetical protein
MPNHVNQRIASLRSLIGSGLHQANLDKIISECNGLAQDTSYVLVFFVLKNVFADLSAALEGEAVTVEQFKELTHEISRFAGLIIDKTSNAEEVEAAQVELLVSTHLRNLNVFRSGR